MAISSSQITSSKSAYDTIIAYLQSEGYAADEAAAQKIILGLVIEQGLGYLTSENIDAYSD